MTQTVPEGVVDAVPSKLVNSEACICAYLSATKQNEGGTVDQLLTSIQEINDGCVTQV